MSMATQIKPETDWNNLFLFLINRIERVATRFHIDLSLDAFLYRPASRRVFISTCVSTRFYIDLRLDAFSYGPTSKRKFISNASVRSFVWKRVPSETFEASKRVFIWNRIHSIQPRLDAVLFENASPVKHSKRLDAFLFQNAFARDFVNNHVWMRFYLQLRLNASIVSLGTRSDAFTLSVSHANETRFRRVSRQKIFTWALSY
jgi:hypothetical protein